LRKQKFGSGGSDVTIIGQGTWYIDRGDRRAAVTALRRGIELGMTHIDTAEMYGDAELVIDPSIPAVIRHKEPDKPKTFSDFEAAAARQQTEAERREELFRRSVSDTKNRESVLGKKFEELLKQAKSEPEDAAPPKRPFDFD